MVRVAVHEGGGLNGVVIGPLFAASMKVGSEMVVMGEEGTVVSLLLRDISV